MLRANKLVPFSRNEIRPLGWLRRQLQIEADGLAGNLDRVWPDVRDSAWIGGDREGWERVPYWLDGFVPLAYLLEEEGMIGRAKRYIDRILASQREDGWLCPCSDGERAHYDMWALILIAKVLTVYADLSGDARVDGALRRAMRQFDGHLDRYTLFNWGAARWFECLIPIFWLYERKPEAWLLTLVRKLRVQGFNYERLFDDYTDTEPKHHWSFHTHVVNMAMCLKMGALTSRLDGSDPDAFARKALDTLQKYHGMPTGHFAGDECMAGHSPSQGTELCGVVEAMYSYEILLAAGGNIFWGDQLERLAFNALPAACTADMWAHQYDQQTNQIRCSRLPEDHVVYMTNRPDANLFGLEPDFGCCTANFGQGWPKLAMSAFMRTQEGLAITALVPARVSATVCGVPVTIYMETEYPFKNTIQVVVQASSPVTFRLDVRIPGYLDGATVDGENAAPGTYWSMRREWGTQTELALSLKYSPKLVPCSDDMYCVWQGPLLYAAAIGEEWRRQEYTANGVERRHPYCDYEILPTTEWRYCFMDKAFETVEHEVPEMPFDTRHPAIEVFTGMSTVDWREAYGVARPAPESRKPLSQTRKVRLIPYGCTQLRMTQMPLGDNSL